MLLLTLETWVDFILEDWLFGISSTLEVSLSYEIVRDTISKRLVVGLALFRLFEDT